MEKGKDLGINVNEQVKTLDKFGNVDQQLKGIGGTLHITQEGEKQSVLNLAWELSKQTQKPVVVVVRAFAPKTP